MTDARLEQIRDWVRGAPRPGGEWRIIQELVTETHHQRAENDRLRTAVDERDAALEDCEEVGNQARRDALTAIARHEWLAGEVQRIARQLHATGQHPAAIDLETAIEQAAALDTSQTEGVVAQQESAPETSGTSAGSSPAHPHPDIAALRKQAAAEGVQAIPALLAAIDQLQAERDEARAAYADARRMANRENWKVMEAKAALSQLRATVLDQADSIAGRPLIRPEADLCARTLRTAAGQEASDEA